MRRMAARSPYCHDRRQRLLLLLLLLLHPHDAGWWCHSGGGLLNHGRSFARYLELAQGLGGLAESHLQRHGSESEFLSAIVHTTPSFVSGLYHDRFDKASARGSNRLDDRT